MSAGGRRARKLLVFVLVPVGLLLLVVLGSALTHPRLGRTNAHPAPNEWVGVVHVHTEASHDGGGTLEQVVEAAAELDFVVITDHNVRALDGSDYREGVLLVTGEEVNTPYGHLSVIGETWMGDRGDAPTGSGDHQRVVVPPGAGLRIASHPTGYRPWTALGEGHFDAIEIWNADTERRGDGVADWLRALSLLPLRPVAALYALQDRPREALELWDRLLAERHVTGVCAVDAHNSLPVSERIDLHFPAYRHSFRMARQHVFLGRAPSGDPVEDARLVGDALERGAAYCAFDGLEDARGARFEVRADGSRAGLGDSIAWSADAVLKAELPPAGARATSVVYRDGAEAARREGASWEMTLPEPGVYRVEVMLRLGRERPWILSNPIHVVEARAQGEGSAARP